jgi:Metallo-peptidase family M12B Reprolysin-like
MGQTAVSNPGTAQIGFIDPLTKLNIAQAAWNQIGVSVTFQPVVQYNSPHNPYSTSPLQPDYRWLHVVNCSTCSTGSSSNDLLLLTQQVGISQGATPATPLSPNPTTINMFFVNTIIPATSGIIINGFSWDSNNGSAISENIFSAPARPDTVAHELGHMLGLEHTTLGAGPLTCPQPYPDSYCPENLMTAGSATRQVPNGLINSSTVNCSGAMLGEACWVPQVPPQNTTQPDALDLLNPSQQAAVLLSGFMNPIPQATTTASDPAKSGVIKFDVSGAAGGRPNETLFAWVLVLPSAAPKVAHPFNIISESRQNLIQDADYPHPDTDNDFGAVYYFGTQTSACATSTARCLIVEFNPPGAAALDYVNFSMSFKTPVTNADLCGAHVIYLFSDGYITTSTLGPSPCSASSVTANSQNPDLTTPPEIADTSTFVGSTNMPCTPLPDGTCPSPLTTGVSDSNPVTGVESGPICYSAGVPVQCP